MRNYTRQTLSIFIAHAKKYKWQASAVAFGVVGHVTLQCIGPIFYQKLIDQIASGSRSNIAPMIHTVKIILLISALRFVFARSFNFVNNNFQPRVMADLMNTCFNYIHQHSFGFFSNNFVGSLVTKVKRYERSFETLSDQLTFDLGKTMVDMVFILVVLFFYNTTIAFLTLGWAVFYLIFSYIFALYKLPVDIKRAAIDTRVTARLADSITNNTNIKVFSSYDFENRKFKEVTDEQFKIRRKSWNLGTTSEAIQAFTMIGLEFWVFYLAVQMWGRGEITVGVITLVQSYYFRIFDRFWSVGKNIRAIYEAIADAGEMTEMLLEPHEVQDKSNAKKLNVKSGLIDFNNVSFAYANGQTVLRNFNLTIKNGEKLALIGPSGGGKTTIVKLLLRFTDVQNGQIKIDGSDITRVTQDSLRAAIAFVPQEPILFHRSLMENIRYARPGVSDAEVVEAAKMAHAHEFIDSFREKYNTLVGERGIKLSGGERQRVAIARAILKDAPILVLDEATSSLDSESEQYIQDALRTLMKNKTAIVIAHRLSTIMQMDRIVVLENGQIKEEGKHKELLKMREGTYQRLWHIQAGGFA